VCGKFLHAGHEKLYLRGVTYGTFRPGPDGDDYPPADILEQDFAQMAAAGINALRTYTVPPRRLLDCALRHGLRVLVGLPWEQHITFLDQRSTRDAIEARMRAEVRACAGHPAVLAFAIGNEIPAPIVRWYGPRRVERYLKRLYDAVKREDPQALVTYVNYPTTEYLDLPFVDFVSFNVYLESPDKLISYLARLHTLAGDRPLVMAEIGLDSLRHGEQLQAEILDWQVRGAFAGGCAGAFVFAWTDAWHRGGYDVLDWEFGLTRADRSPKPALAAVAQAFAQAPLAVDGRWPRVSVVVCSYNGARTIRDCLNGLSRLRYPDFEVIVVDDGSTDATALIAREYDARLISTENRGLSAARNAGALAASGEIIAYLDDDAWPDPDWLTYLARTFMTTSHAVVGGPNITPAGDGWVADCVANAPGNPNHVLLTDQLAEHVPGCNLAALRDRLLALGGFDEQFRVAGDDVDLCWRVQAEGWTIGFAPAAMVWHHRRPSVRAYWRQQLGYARAEALLARKWPEKYNLAGHAAWAGRAYGKGAAVPLLASRRIYGGTWGSAPFQSIYEPAPDVLRSLPLMPEWYLVLAALGYLAATGLLWWPLIIFVPVLALAVLATIAQVVHNAARATFVTTSPGAGEQAKLRAMTAFLHLAQPLARVIGRLRHGLGPWQRRAPGFTLARRREMSVWCEHWDAGEQRLHAVERSLRHGGALPRRGGEFDRWDLEVPGGLLASVRLRITIEEHGEGKQLVRFYAWPRYNWFISMVITVLAVLAGLAALDAAWLAALLLAAAALTLAGRGVYESGSASAAVRDVVGRAFEREQRVPVLQSAHERA
jgi:GT2 family glycosyltransferase